MTIEINNNVIQVKGYITFSTVTAQLQAFSRVMNDPELKDAECLSVDFKEVESVNSAALSFLAFIARAAKKRHKTLSCINLPAHLLSLAEVSGVDEILGLRSN